MIGVYFGGGFSEDDASKVVINDDEWGIEYKGVKNPTYKLDFKNGNFFRFFYIIILILYMLYKK